MSLSLAALLPFVPNAFGALAQVTIVRTAPSTSAPIATSLLLDTLRLLVCPPNATYIADGDIVIDSVPLEFVVYAIEEAIDDCPLNVLSPEQATHIFGDSSNSG